MGKVKLGSSVVATATAAVRRGNVSRFPISDFHSLSEADLAHLWEGQRFPPEALRTAAGVQLRTVYRGRRTGGPGPDYRDAIISAPGELLQGDVELHVRSSDFRRHGHHLDGAYDGLALHLVFRRDDADDTELAGGRRVPVVALGDWADGRAREIRAWLERPASWEEPCHSAVTRLGATAAGAALDRLGDMRFRAKAAAFAKWLPSGDADQALWEGIIEALAYGGERELLRAVAIRLPWASLAPRLGAAPAKGRAKIAETSLLEALAEEEHAPRESVRRPVLAVRPRNRPGARLQGAAALAARFAGAGPWESLRPLVCAGDQSRLIAELTVRGSVGPGRAVEIAANAVLPCAAAAGLGAEAEAIYRRLPLPARYGAVRHLHSALGGAVRTGMRRQQGMLYLLRGYCTQGGCGRCVLS